MRFRESAFVYEATEIHRRMPADGEPPATLRRPHPNQGLSGKWRKPACDLRRPPEFACVPR